MSCGHAYLPCATIRLPRECNMLDARRPRAAPPSAMIPTHHHHKGAAMRLSRVFSLIVAAGLLLAACGLPGQEPAADITPTVPAQPVAAINPTATPAGAPKPTQAAPGVPTEAPAPPSKGTVTFAFDAFATYYPGIIMDTRGLLKKRG